MTVIGNRIQQLRKEKGISQQELADYLGIERTSLSKIENMKYNPSARIMQKIAEYFNLPIGDIFFNNFVSRNDTKEAI
ncbi:hypothetical protein B4065_0121 [Caldibacillus thermoamylovorans]|uniref:helix-turn-helix transcriptional regulator n=1 Tax=Caldibacillus thermoamylovorans TaxID=35841 RepID=UPI0005A42C94|nr:helix-turn-helix transcriptional regulator [Caldibacillus thermoamylovorans]KIO60195.1 hypothetical protein B4065_0121 [Caldibacillus thermoamylovorans]